METRFAKAERGGHDIYMYPLGSYLFCGNGTQYTGPELQLDLESAIYSEGWPPSDIVIDDELVFDKHVSRGMAKHTSIAYFAEESSKVSNEIVIAPPVFKTLFMWLKTRTIV